jgi:FlaG/FlaF family flagellin (archaellin)
MFGLSITLFMPPLIVVLMTIVFVLAALFATFIIMQSSEHSS